MRDRYGPPEVVEVREVDQPDADGRPGAGPRPRGVGQPRRPRRDPARAGRSSACSSASARRGTTTVGLDVAGVVEAVGPDVTRFKPGDAVFADLFALRQRRLRRLRLRPGEGLPADPRRACRSRIAATLPHSARPRASRACGMRNGRTLKPGDKVLIDGASGNVGPFAVQIAKSMGAEVTGACSTAKLDFVRSLGADHVIDYTKVDYTRDRRAVRLDRRRRLAPPDPAVRRALQAGRRLRDARRARRRDRSARSSWAR